MATEEGCNKETVEATGPGGFGVKFSSSDRGTSVQFLMTLAIAALLIFGYQKIDAKADEIKAAWQRSEETQQALIYMLSLKQEQREALNISKPRIIREMQRRETNP